MEIPGNGGGGGMVSLCDGGGIAMTGGGGGRVSVCDSGAGADIGGGREVSACTRGVEAGIGGGRGMVAGTGEPNSGTAGGRVGAAFGGIDELTLDALGGGGCTVLRALGGAWKVS
jgi:hypothetical protein